MLINSTFDINYLSISLIIFVIVAVLATWQIVKQKYKTKLLKLEQESITKINSLESKTDILNNINENLKDKIDTFETHSRENLENLEKSYQLRLSKQEEIFSNKEDQLYREFDIKEENFNEKISLLENSKAQLKLEFESLANKLFEENQKKSNTNLNQVVTSFKDQLDTFGKRVNDIYNDETKQRSSLLTEIKNLKELNNQISQDALNLTKALKGENKTQGDWGEMILSKILEQTGLREGKEYSTQGSYTDHEGKRLRPDVIVHLPQDKDIVIDSKVSLNAYLKYIESEDVKIKEEATKELTKSLYAHIKGLSAKSYEDIDDVKTLDFVLMFIPIEGAFMLAASNDNHLFKTAFEHNIMLVSPSTLFVTLRTIENIWRYEHQNENALDIATKAGFLYDKFALFVKDLEDIGANISKTQKAYDGAINKLSTGNGNLLKRSEALLELGVKTKKRIDTKKLLGDENGLSD